ncbi:MAG TPA: hypothetical protein VNA25_17385 [Phycisphaerae bacterium]|nr:hypothetical protein [Phycisphaerae bacterium]HUT59622.1 hypothetical protein [Phycisphaerae bacterium]
MDLLVVLAIAAVAVPILGFWAHGCSRADRPSLDTGTQPSSKVNWPLTSAKREALCQSNLKSVGIACHGFAVEHNGRFPGRAHSTVEAEYVSWQLILNREYFHNNDRDCYPTREGAQAVKGPILRWWDGKTDPNTSRTRWLTCPSLTPYGSTARRMRPYAMSRDAAGGCDPGNADLPFHGRYGRRLEPRAIHPDYDRYALGTRAEVFPEPAEQFLICESEAAVDEIYYRKGGDRDGRVRLGDSADFPPWSAAKGAFAFRHTDKPALESDPNHARGNFVFIDGHVESLGPHAEISTARRLSLQR